MANNAVGWFEIPVVDINRAIRVYESVLGMKIERHQFGPLDMAWFPGDQANELGRVEKAGGKILMPKTQISEEYGFMTLLLDTEGNRIALHSRK